MKANHWVQIGSYGIQWDFAIVLPVIGIKIGISDKMTALATPVSYQIISGARDGSNLECMEAEVGKLEFLRIQFPDAHNLC